jgi:hypothetical protein
MLKKCSVFKFNNKHWEMGKNLPGQWFEELAMGAIASGGVRIGHLSR